MTSDKYIRDGRAPIPKSEITSKVMRANKGKDTNPEMDLRKALRKIGITGYRLHWKKAPGRPDIVYPKRKIAIFVHGCFWHRCPHCNLPLPKSNLDFWKQKFARNKKRDKDKMITLTKQGWKVFVFWECMIKDDAISCAKKIKRFIKNN